MNALFPGPAADFDHPIEILDSCHGKILRNCVLVERIAAHVAAKGLDEEARTAAAGVIRYFDTAGANHHRDEEQDLFPALQQYAPSAELNAVFALLFKLRSDHRKLDALWDDMRRRLAHIVAGRDGDLPPAVAAHFHAAYRQHIALEEAEVLPLARRVLEPRIVAALGSRMAARRGARPQKPGSDPAQTPL